MSEYVTFNDDKVEKIQSQSESGHQDRMMRKEPHGGKLVKRVIEKQVDKEQERRAGEESPLSVGKGE